MTDAEYETWLATTDMTPKLLAELDAELKKANPGCTSIASLLSKDDWDSLAPSATKRS
jgi:hypothetical protein